MLDRLRRVTLKSATWFALTLLIFPYYIGRAFADDVGFGLFGGAHAFDEAIGFGTLPSARLQAWFFDGQWGLFEDLNLFVHLMWFYLPLALSVYILFVHWPLFIRFALARLVVLYLGLLLFVLLPTEPPWMTDPEAVTRLWAIKTPGLTVLDANYVAAFPSLHVAGPASIAFWLFLRRERDLRLLGVVFLTYTAATSFTVLYMGEHFLADVVAGLALAAIVVACEDRAFRLWQARGRLLPSRQPAAPPDWPRDHAPPVTARSLDAP